MLPALATVTQPCTSTGRERLPNRRTGETVGVEFAGHCLSITVGCFPDGRIGEVFLRSAKCNSELDRLAGDVGVLLSLLLQHGVEPAQIAHSLGRLDGGPEPASLIGAAVELLAELERAAGRCGGSGGLTWLSVPQTFDTWNTVG